MSEQERQVPVWHSIVGADHEPVQVNDMTHLGEDVLVASGWIAASGGGFRQQPDSLPRRRRKHQVMIEVSSEQDGVPFQWWCFAKPGDCFQLGDSGRLIPIDKPPA